MRYYYDCEFHEDGKTIDFISIGILAEDGRRFYAVANDFDTRRVAQNNWLMKNVMDSIDHEQFITYDWEGKPAVRDIYVTDTAARPKSEIGRQIAYFVGGDREAEFWAWYSAYDHVCLAQLFGRMIDLPDMIPMVTHDIQTLVKLAGVEPKDVPKQPAGHHNALADAMWNKVRYDYLMEKLNN